MEAWRGIALGLAAAVLAAAGCSGDGAAPTELMQYPLDALSPTVAAQGGVLDEAVSTDGGGSLRFTVSGQTTLRLLETGDLDLEAARLLYRAQVRCQDVQGMVFLEMVCRFPELGEYFSRDLATPLNGTADWSLEETPFQLLAGQNPDNVKLNLVITGPGTVWIDDIRLLSAPLE